MARTAAFSDSTPVGETISVIQPWKAPRSASATPRSSQITVMGSGWAKTSIRSARRSGRASIPSSSPSTISWMRGRSVSIRPGAKERPTSRRSRVWSGGSARIMLALASVRSRSA